MQAKIKKIIKREGLIILGIILCGVFLAYLGGFLSFQKSNCSFQKSNCYFFNQRYKQPGTSDKYLSKEKILEDIRGEYPQYDSVDDAIFAKVIENELKRCGQSGKLRLLVRTAGFCGIFLLFLGYPIYLSIRFIIWAIKALRK
ncbi:MAG: hypothetical protein K9L86_00930 [Candidatus Omnitrophica bacterium]|nr:hypothetical protein [Candidatus Omnitrophota bacterium]